MALALQLPNFLTILRMLLTPVIIFCLYHGTDFWSNMAVCFFAIASLTDYFDGFLARKYQLKSAFGQLLDPVADKILVNSVLIMLIGQLDVFIVIILIIRDILVQGVRSCAAAENLIIPAIHTGKWKTVFQMAGLMTIMIKLPFTLPLYEIGYGLLCVSVVLSLISGYQYCHQYAQFVQSSKTKTNEKQTELHNEKQIKILELLNGSPLYQKEISEKIGYDSRHKDGLAHTDLKYLEGKKLIKKLKDNEVKDLKEKFEGLERRASSFYKITDKGKSFFNRSS